MRKYLDDEEPNELQYSEFQSGLLMCVRCSFGEKHRQYSKKLQLKSLKKLATDVFMFQLHINISILIMFNCSRVLDFVGIKAEKNVLFSILYHSV